MEDRYDSELNAAMLLGRFIQFLSPHFNFPGLHCSYLFENAGYIH